MESTVTCVLYTSNVRSELITHPKFTIAGDYLPSLSIITINYRGLLRAGSTMVR